jgi:lysophospholipase L1-like esterase
MLEPPARGRITSANAMSRHDGKDQHRRWWSLFLAASLAIGGFTGFHYYFWILRPVGSGPAGPTVNRALFQSVWTTNPVWLVGLGDSVTAGFGATPGLSYFERLVTNPAGEFPEMDGLCLKALLPNLLWTNLAVSGSTSRQHIERQIPRLPKAPPNVLGLVVITTGGNDLIHHYGKAPPRPDGMYGATWDQAQPWVQAFDQRLEEMLQQIQAAFPGGCHVFLANIYDPTDGLGDIERTGLPPWPHALRIHAAYNEVISQAALRHPSVHLVDLHREFLGHGIHCNQFWRATHRPDDPHYWYGTNLEDPNDRGYDAVRRLFLKRMAEVFGRR